MDDPFLTIVFRDLTKEEREELIYHPKFSAGSVGHVMDERDYLKNRLQKMLNEASPLR